MASAPRPALPREQDEWSALSKYDAQMDKRKAKEGRRKQLQQMMTVREELDAQVAYNQAMREKAILDEQGTVKKSVGTASVCKIYNPLARKLIVHHSTLPLSTANATQCTQPPLWNCFSSLHGHSNNNATPSRGFKTFKHVRCQSKSIEK
jgi:hypothetical protein